MVRVVLHWGFQLLGEGDWLLAFVVHHIPFRFALSHSRYVLCLLMNVNVELNVYGLINLWSLDLWLKTSMLRNRSKSFKNRFPFFELFTCKSHMVEMLKCWNGVLKAIYLHLLGQNFLQSCERAFSSIVQDRWRQCELKPSLYSTPCPQCTCSAWMHLDHLSAKICQKCEVQ